MRRSRAEHEAEALLAEAYEATAKARVILETALDAATEPFAVWAVDRGRPELTRLLAANHAIHQVMPMSKEEALEHDLSTIFASDGPEVVHRVHADLLAALDRYEPITCADVTLGFGSHLRIWRPVTTAVGEDDVVIMALHDVTALVGESRALQAERDAAAAAARSDPLTGLCNRLALTEALDELRSEQDQPASPTDPGDWTASAEPGERLAVAFVDLDGFKAVNDTYGHEAGDELLVAIASRLTELTRRGDIVARLAGDEFVLLLRDLPDSWDPEAFTARVITCLSRPVGVSSGALVAVGASLGIVTSPPAPRDPDLLLSAADTAMYAHKRSRHLTA